MVLFPGSCGGGSEGNFYGTTLFGGSLNKGTVFKISSDGTLVTLYSFTGGSDSGQPVGGVAQGSDGSFYGATSGTYYGNRGTVFKLSANGALTGLYSFTGGNEGANPYAGQVQGNDGSFYGTTGFGGVGGVGTVFRLTIEPEFQAVTLTNSTLILTWSTEAGGRYQLQYNSDLSSNNWINLGSAVTATGATVSATDSVTNAARRFYSVVLSQ